MANERIRIDDLPSTSFPSLDHIVAAMKDGSTVRLTVAQMRAVMLGGADNVALALKDLSNTTGPRGKFAAAPNPSADLNSYLEFGHWIVAAGAPNCPLASWGVLRVETDGGGTAATQYVREYLTDTAADSKLYKREFNSGVWTAWYRVRETEEELDARYNLPAGAVLAFDRNTAPAGWLKANGALLLRTAYSALDAAIYCGDLNNATAEWGYRTNSTDTVRSTTGTHIRLRDYRGEFIRGWDDGRGVDTSRSLWAAQAQSFQSHTHPISDPSHNHGQVGGGNPAGSGTAGAAGQSANSYSLPTLFANTGVTVVASGSAETRPRNQAALICIKY